MTSLKTKTSHEAHPILKLQFKTQEKVMYFFECFNTKKQETQAVDYELLMLPSHMHSHTELMCYD